MSDLSLSLSSDGSALPSLFFRAADRLRLEGCVAAICQEGRSLALSSQHDAALDHYGQLLVARLRQAAPSAQLEVYFPTNTDAMLTRFNEALAQQSLRQAMQEHGQGQGEQPAQVPERIWLVHDAGALAEHELQLLARLVTNFPGANIRVVLLLGGSTRSRKAFDSLGRRIVRWDIEGPTSEQAQGMLAQARTDGCEGLVSDLLQKIQPGLQPGGGLVAPLRGRAPLADGDDLQALGLAAATDSAAAPQATPFTLSAHEALQRRQASNTSRISPASRPAQLAPLGKAAGAGKMGAAWRQRLGSAWLRLRQLPWRRLPTGLLGLAGWALRHGPRGLGQLLGQARRRAGWVAAVGALGLGSVAVAAWLNPGLFSRQGAATEAAAAKSLVAKPSSASSASSALAASPTSTASSAKPADAEQDSRETARLARRSADMITEPKP